MAQELYIYTGSYLFTAISISKILKIWYSFDKYLLTSTYTVYMCKMGVFESGHI